MRPFTYYAVQVALQVLGPIVVEAAPHSNFEGIVELLCDDFRGGPLRTHVLRQFRGNGETQLRRVAAADDHLFDGNFLQRQVLRIRAQQNPPCQLSGGQARRVRAHSKAR